MMGSRVKKSSRSTTSSTLFTCYVTLAEDGSSTVFPFDYKDVETLKSAAAFAVPCQERSPTVQLFTFIITSSAAKYTFGFARSPPTPSSGPVTYFLSNLNWQEVFYRALNHVAENVNDSDEFVQKLYGVKPEAGACVNVKGKVDFVAAAPLEGRLPEIPGDRNLSELYNSLTPPSLITLFSALLSERRIIITSSKLSRLSSIALSCNNIIYPMTWQHIFIPVLPSSLVDYLSAPMPYIIGVRESIWSGVAGEGVGQVVRVEADSDTVFSPFPEDLESLPLDVVSCLRKSIESNVVGDSLARGFLRALAGLFGHWMDGVVEGRFDEELFTRLAPPHHRPFLRTRLLKLQIFQQFIEERLALLNNGDIYSDEFELEASYVRQHARARLKGAAQQNGRAIRKAGKAVLSQVKSQGNSLMEHVKHNSAVRSAVRSVKDTSKSVKSASSSALSEVRSRFNMPSTNYLHPNPSKSNGAASLGPLSISASASYLPSLHEEAKDVKRKCKSEENLIDFDSFKGELELVDLDESQTERQLLEEYGLEEFFGAEREGAGWATFD